MPTTRSLLADAPSAPDAWVEGPTVRAPDDASARVEAQPGTAPPPAAARLLASQAAAPLSAAFASLGLHLAAEPGSAATRAAVRAVSPRREFETSTGPAAEGLSAAELADEAILANLDAAAVAGWREPVVLPDGRTVEARTAPEGMPRVTNLLLRSAAQDVREAAAAPGCPPPREEWRQSFVDCCTLAPLREAVVAPDGHTYEASTMVEALRHSRLSPRTNLPLGAAGETITLLPNQPVNALLAAARGGAGAPCGRPVVVRLPPHPPADAPAPGVVLADDDWQFARTITLQMLQRFDEGGPFFGALGMRPIATPVEVSPLAQALQQLDHGPPLVEAPRGSWGLEFLLHWNNQ